MMGRMGEQLRQFADREKASLEKATRGAVLDTARQIIKMSPVDTGRFKSNWQYGANIINADTSRKPGENAEDAIQVGIATWTPGETMYITNSLPYAQRLENGWSKLQAPTGMVKVSMTYFARNFASALQEARQ